MCGYSEETLRVAMWYSVQGLHYRQANRLIRDNVDLGRLLAEKEAMMEKYSPQGLRERADKDYLKKNPTANAIAQRKWRRANRKKKNKAERERYALQPKRKRESKTKILPQWQLWNAYKAAEKLCYRTARKVKVAHHAYGADTPEHKEAKRTHSDTVTKMNEARAAWKAYNAIGSPLDAPGSI